MRVFICEAVDDKPLSFKVGDEEVMEIGNPPQDIWVRVTDITGRMVTFEEVTGASA